MIGLALVGLLLGGPIVAGPFAGRRIVSAIEEGLAAHAALGSLALRVPGTARLRNFELTDLDEAPILTVERLDVSAGVLAAAFGRYRADVTLEGFELHLRQRADGRWNVQELPRAGAPEGPDDRSDERTGAGSHPATEVPDVRAHVRIGPGRVVVHTPDGACGLEQLALELDVRSLEQAAPFTCSGRLFGPAGDAGTVRIEGQLTAAAEGLLGAAGLRANLGVALGDVLLDALSPALALLVRADSIEGRLAGNLQLELGSDLALVGAGSLVVTSLRMRGPLDTGEPRAVERIELVLGATRPGATTGAVELRLTADDFAALELDLALEGSLFSASSNGELTAELALRADAGGLVDRLAGWVPFEGDNAYGGALSARTDLSMRTEASELAALTARADVRVTDFAATDADGHAIDVGELTSAKLDLEASYDLARGAFSLPRFELLAGPIEARGKARLRGLGGGSDGAVALAVDDSELRAEVDLERLHASLAAFADVGDFGGALSARVRKPARSGSRPRSLPARCG